MIRIANRFFTTSSFIKAKGSPASWSFKATILGSPFDIECGFRHLEKNVGIDDKNKWEAYWTTVRYLSHRKDVIAIGHRFYNAALIRDIEFDYSNSRVIVSLVDWTDDVFEIMADTTYATSKEKMMAMENKLFYKYGSY